MLMNLVSDDTRRNPYPGYDLLRGSSPVFHFEPADLWLVLDYEGVRRVLTDHESFSSNVAPSRGIRFEWLLFMDPPRHTKLRNIILRAFTPRSIANLEPRIRELSRSLLNDVIERGEMDLVGDFAAPLPMMVIAEMIGLPIGEWPRLKGWSEAIINLGNTLSGGAEGARASLAFNAANAEMKDYFTRLLGERRASPREDLLSRLADAEVDGERLDEEEILRFSQLLLAAGTETTTNLVDNTILCLLDNPSEQARLLAAPDLLPSAIEEVLRYRTPVQAMFRTTARDVELCGRVIPSGKFVMAMIGSANRDPRQFPDAARFDITREPNPHLAFGHGIHFCLGAPLSRLEGRIALSDFLSRIQDFSRATEGPWEPRKSFHVHGPSRLPIRFQPGRPA
jgi:cytochrome P450